ncbi:MAG: secretin and TonB N-terminal domain-containing protein [Candidatus Omnitrophica bacterium]|nr:secretin and TonB N-terminal domain-containing protein [Candidatus Omnitrophota bacterium]
MKPIFVLILILLMTGAAQAQQPAAVPVTAGSVMEESLNQHVQLDFRDLDIIDTLKFLAMKGGINIIAGKDVVGKVSLFLKDVTIKDALDIILQANNLAYEKRGGIIYVMTEAEYKNIKGNNYKDTRQIKLFSLKYTKPDSVFRALDTFKSDIGKIVVDEETGTVVIMDTPERIAAMEPIIADLDQQPLTKTFVFQYARAKDVQAVLTTRLDSKKTGVVSLDERGNSLIVTALPGRMTEVEELIKGLDKKTKEVLLEVKILKVILNDNFFMGVDWSKILTSMRKQGLNMTSTFNASSGSISPGSYFQLGMGGEGHDYSTVLRALAEFGETRNLSSPSIAVTNGEQAKIHIGSSKPYVTTSQAVGASATTSTTSAQVSFIELGVQLEVTPIINDEGFVTMRIKPEISSQDGEVTYYIASGVQNTVPNVARTTAETNVMVKDGTTIVIGGLRKDEKVKTTAKVPLLGDIPLIGLAFRSKSDKTEKDEIVVFITPHIISGDTPAVDAGLKPKGIRR